MITPERKTIEDILKGSGNKFLIPLYQRSFDWGKSELQELMDDLKDVKDSENKELFLGNFIFDTSEKNNFKIVDGQQRLTTISIILIALREHAKKIKEFELAGELQSLISINSSWSGEQGNKISVSENIRDVFEYISNREWDGKFPEKIGTKFVRRQVNKIKPIFNYVIGELSEYNKENLQDFTKAILYSYVVVIKIENTEDVFSIFERTNARGLDLNVGNLLKNYIFAHGVNEFEDKWNEIISNTENSLQRMLKYFWVSRKGYAQQVELYKNLKRYGNEIGIDKFIDELYSFSRYYKTVQSLDSDDTGDWLEEIGLEELSKNEDHRQRINRVFQALKLFRVTQAYPLIYSIFKFYKNSGSKSYKNLINVLEFIEKYHFINNVISGRMGNEVEKFYADKSQEFFNNDESENKFIEIMNEFINEFRDKKVKKDEFVTKFVDVVTSEDKPLVNYVFDRINNFNAKGAERVDLYYPEKNYEKRNYNTEHFFPQKYKKDYAEDQWEFFDKVGNLLVISRHANSRLGDKLPLEKIKIIKEDPKNIGNLKYLHDFVKDYENDFKNWNFESIEKRSRAIAEEGYDKIWSF